MHFIHLLRKKLLFISSSFCFAGFFWGRGDCRMLRRLEIKKNNYKDENMIKYKLTINLLIMMKVTMNHQTKYKMNLHYNEYRRMINLLSVYKSKIKRGQWIDRVLVYPCHLTNGILATLTDRSGSFS